MTVDQWIQSSGQTFKRAREIERMLVQLANEAPDDQKAEAYLQTARLVLPAATRYVTSKRVSCIAEALHRVCNGVGNGVGNG